MLWDDEFSGAAGTGPDPAKWSTTTGSDQGGSECYTSQPANVALDGAGHLTLTARYAASCGGMGYSSGRIETRDRASWKYGYFEIRARLPTAAGTLPAIWMLGPNGAADWPRSGETDIAEVVANDPSTVHTNLHGIDGQGNNWEAGWDGPGKSVNYRGSSVSDGYHTYALDWTQSALKFYFDGVLVRNITRDQTPVWLWDNPFYLILNIAVGQIGITEAPVPSVYPQSMAVDYVRIYSGKP